MSPQPTDSNVISRLTSVWLLDTTFAVLSLLMVSGITLDFRSHGEGISFAEEGFFTPEHVFFYSVFLVIAGLLATAMYRRWQAGASIASAVPPGFGLGVVGIFLFGFGGVGDFFWHSAFGFEEGVEALVSPSHITLGAGAALFLAAPVRSALQNPHNYRGLRSIPVLVSTALVSTIIVLFGLLLNPLAQLGYVVDEPMFRTYALGWSSLVVFPLFFVATGLLLNRRFELPSGLLTITFLVPALASVSLLGVPVFVLPVILGGIALDAIVQWNDDHVLDGLTLRLFGVVFPRDLRVDVLRPHRPAVPTDVGGPHLDRDDRHGRIGRPVTHLCDGSTSVNRLANCWSQDGIR